MTPPTTYRIADKAPEFPCWVWDSAVPLWWSCSDKGEFLINRDQDDTHWCDSDKRPTHDPTAPATPATSAAKGGAPQNPLRPNSLRHEEAGSSVHNNESGSANVAAPAVAMDGPAGTISAKGGDIPRTPKDSQMQWKEWRRWTWEVLINHQGAMLTGQRIDTIIEELTHKQAKHESAAIAAAMMKGVRG